MVVGNGLIANSFKNEFPNENVIIFAAGVSNSKEELVENFQREIKTIYDLTKLKRKIVYFSTTSVNSNEVSQYIQHKLYIENIIENNFEDYLIIRVPNIVGRSNNKKQLFGYLFNSLINKIPITIFINEYRWLIDSDDLYNIVNLLINFPRKKIDVFFENKISVENLIKIIELQTDMRFVIKNKIDRNLFNNSSNSEFIKIKSDSDLIFNEKIEEIVKKYIKHKSYENEIVH
jgi:nucleoside-diphosphate-sugar epimerase